MALLPITLGVRRTSGTERTSSAIARLDKKNAEKILQRDDYTCRFCGFRSQQYQRFVYCLAAGDPPYATACNFCEQCMTLDRAGLSGSGILVWLPEIKQVDLNHIVRAIYVARTAKGDLAAAANRALEALTARRAEAKKRLGSDDPLVLATVMQESLSDEEYENAAAKIEGVRFLPLDKHVVRTAKGDVNQFQAMVKYWCSPKGPFARLPVERWMDLFKASASAEGRA